MERPRWERGGRSLFRRDECRVCGDGRCIQHCPVCGDDMDAYQHDRDCPVNGGVYPVVLGETPVRCEGCASVSYYGDVYTYLVVGEDRRGDPVTLLLCLGCACRAECLDHDD